MKYFLIFSLFILNSCASFKNTHSYFSDCERKFNEFSKLSSCALKEIQNNCENNSNCPEENNRFVDIMKRLQIMVDNNEISNNEAMFRYFNLMDLEETKLKIRNMDFPSYDYYPNNYYFRGIFLAIFRVPVFCY